MAKREKKKNNKKNRLLLLILLLICTAVIMGGSTYAWFISNKTVSVDSLDVQARTSSGLQISASAEASDWASSINKADLISSYDSNTNQFPSILDHFSTGGVIDTTTGKMNMYLGTVNSECTGTWDTAHQSCSGNIYYTLTSTKGSEVQCYDKDGSGNDNTDSKNKCAQSSQFIAFDIFLKYTGTDGVPLFLGANSGVTKTENKSYGIENATRVAFVVEGHMSIDDYNTAVDNKDLTGITLAKDANNETGEDKTVFIWEPNSEAHTQSAISNAYDYYGLTITKSNPRIAYDGVIDEFTGVNLKTENNASTNGTYFKSVTPDIVTTSSMSRTSTGIKLNSGVTKIRVYFWVEGQDVDTENDATGHNMKLNLEFSIN